MHLHSWLLFSMVHLSFRECTPNATPPGKKAILRMHYHHVRFPGGNLNLSGLSLHFCFPFQVVAADEAVASEAAAEADGIKKAQWEWKVEANLVYTPWKLTCFLKINDWKMYSLPKEFLFRGHVSFRVIIIHPGKLTF